MNRPGVFYVNYFSWKSLLEYYPILSKYLLLIVVFILSACVDNKEVGSTNIDLAYQDPTRAQATKANTIEAMPHLEETTQGEKHNTQLLSERITPTSFTSEASDIPAKKFSQDKQRVIKNLIASYHYKRPQAKNITSSSLTDMSMLNRYLKSLDAYSRYIPKAQLEFIRHRQRKVRKGIGLSLLIDHNKILVVPVNNGSLYNAGLDEPRYLKTLNNRRVDYNDFSSYKALVDTALGRAIDLIIVPYSQTEKTNYRILMQTIKRKPIIYREVADTAVIRIDEFSDEVANKIKISLKKARHKQHLVIDLRYSPGGDLYATVDVASFFLKAGILVTQLTQRGQYAPIELNTLNTFKDQHKKIYVLTSRFTASAAEIFIHALQYNHSNIVVLGEKTVGKCLAQSIHELADHSALLLSSYELTLPTKKACQGRGIQPDKIIKNIELLSTKAVLLHIK
ncbi:MAG TPA: hypothetical protein ENK78_05100 [Thiothrix sp.]|nr:hypothetical protein [Thiothrix sp.]